MTGPRHEGRVDVRPLAAGEALAPGYEVLAHLHQSRNFDVYDVFSGERACRCIAKAPRRDLLEDEKVLRGLVEEGRLLAKLTHPHIVRAYETIEGPRPALILETLTGETLAHLIDTSHRRLAIRDIAHLGLHLCSALHYLHGHGILHLDLKPSNIVSEHQMAKILDLSIARPPGPARPGAGTRQYMAPEQIRGGEVTPATDVWGLGAVLYEAATDVTPFNAEYETDPGTSSGTEDPEYETGSESEFETEDPESYEQITRRVEPVRSHRRVPAAFARLLETCLDPDPASRPTLSDLNGTLRGLI